MADEEPPVGSNEWIKQRAGSALGAAASSGINLLNTLTRPRGADEAQAAYEASRAAARDAAEQKEGARLETLPAAPAKARPFTNPDGTPWTRDQMRRYQEQSRQGAGKRRGGQVKAKPRGVGCALRGHGKGTMR